MNNVSAKKNEKDRGRRRTVRANMCKHRLAACDMLLEVQWTVRRMHLKCHKFMRHVEYLGRAAQNILSNLKLPAGFDLRDLATQVGSEVNNFE